MCQAERKCFGGLAQPWHEANVKHPVMCSEVLHLWQLMHWLTNSAGFYIHITAEWLNLSNQSADAQPASWRVGVCLTFLRDRVDRGLAAFGFGGLHVLHAEAVRSMKRFYIHLMRIFCVLSVWNHWLIPQSTFLFQASQLLQLIKLFISCNLQLWNLFDRWAFKEQESINLHRVNVMVLP